MSKKYSPERIKEITAMVDALENNKEKTWTAEELKERMDKIIIGNDFYKEKLAQTLSNYLSPRKKRDHMIVVGPSGTGKTHLIRTILPEFKIPFAIINGGTLVPSGIKGVSISEALKSELFDRHPKAYEKAIIVVDEFDKLSDDAAEGNFAEGRGAAVQNELLMAIEGMKEGSIDTTQSLWIMLGAFSYADEMRAKPPSFSFSSLGKYGFKPEFVGRFSSMVMTEIPSNEVLVQQILTSHEVAAFFEQLAGSGYKSVDFTNEAIVAMVGKVKSYAGGLRSIRKIVAGLEHLIVFSVKPDKSQHFDITPQHIEDAARGM